MNRVFVSIAAILVLTGLSLAIFAPIDDMGTREAFFARLILLAPPVFLSLVLLAFSRVIFLLQTMTDQQRTILHALAGAPAALTEFSDKVEASDQLTSDEAEEEVVMPFLEEMNDNSNTVYEPKLTGPLLSALGAQKRDAVEDSEPSNFESMFAAELMKVIPANERVTYHDEKTEEHPGIVIEPGASQENEIASRLEYELAAISISETQMPAQELQQDSALNEAYEQPQVDMGELRIAPSYQEDWQPQATEQPAPPSNSADNGPDETSHQIAREGQFAGRRYRMFDDGSLEIDTDQSTIRFSNLEEFRSFIEASAKR